MMANDRGSYQSSDFVRSLLPMCRNEAFGYPRRRHDGGILSDIKCDKEKFQVIFFNTIQFTIQFFLD